MAAHSALNPPRSRGEIAREVAPLCVGAALVAAILYAVWPSAAFLIVLVTVGPIAAVRCHTDSDERSIMIGAVAGVGATLGLFMLGGVIALGFALIALVLGGEVSSPWPVSVQAAAMTCIGTAAGGGAAAFLLQMLTDWAEKG
jgi:hypothetical protein